MIFSVTHSDPQYDLRLIYLFKESEDVKVFDIS